MSRDYKPIMELKKNDNVRHMVTGQTYCIISFPLIRIQSKEWEPGVSYFKFDKDGKVEEYACTREDFEGRFQIV